MKKKPLLENLSQCQLIPFEPLNRAGLRILVAWWK